MADDLTFELKGLDDIIDRLSRFAPKLQKKALRTAVRKGANVIRDAAIAGAERIDDPFTQEAIYKNVQVQYSSRGSKRSGGVMMRVGVRGGARQYTDTVKNRRAGRVGKTYKTLGDKSNPGGDTWYWRFLEFGTSRSRARPFLRPAFNRNRDKALTIIATDLDREITRLATTNASE